MRWIKVLAIAAAVLVVFSLVSFLVHLAYLVLVGVVIAVIVGTVVKISGRYRARQELKARKRDSTAVQPRAAPPSPVRQEPDVEDELARLRREIEN